MPDVPNPRPAPDDLVALADTVGVLLDWEALDFEHVPMCEADRGRHDVAPPADFLVVVKPSCKGHIRRRDGYLCEGCWDWYRNQRVRCSYCDQPVTLRAEALR